MLGATGYTGKLVAEWVSMHLPEDLKWAIAGRNAKKLQGVVDELTKLSPNRKQPGMSMGDCGHEKSRSSRHSRRSVGADAASETLVLR